MSAAAGIEPWVVSIVEEMLENESFSRAGEPATQASAQRLWRRVLTRDDRAVRTLVWYWWDMSTHTRECAHPRGEGPPGEGEELALSPGEVLDREDETYQWNGYSCECLRVLFAEREALELSQDQQCREVLADWLSVLHHQRVWQRERSLRARRELRRAVLESAWSVEHNSTHWDGLRESQGLAGISGPGAGASLIRAVVDQLCSMARELLGERGSGPVALVLVQRREWLHAEAQGALLRGELLRGEHTWVVVPVREGRAEQGRSGLIPEELWERRGSAAGGQALMMLVGLLEENAELDVAAAAGAAAAATAGARVGA